MEISHVEISEVTPRKSCHEDRWFDTFEREMRETSEGIILLSEEAGEAII
jgi:hypothetical protein